MLVRFAIAGLIGFFAGLSLADESVSSRFRLDLHYDSSGEVFPGPASKEVSQLSSRFTAATVVRAADVNQNGIPDAWEEIYGLFGVDAAAGADPDGDGRTNLQEYNAGTNPIIAENYDASRAVSAAWTLDTWIESTGGIGSTLLEVWAISSAFTVDTAGRAPDTDKDGLPDWFEKLYGLNPNLNDAALDPDGDGRTNLQEYNAGTNPVLADDWTKSSATGEKPFVCDTRVWYTGGNPSFDDAFAVIRTSNGFICDTGGLYYDWDGDGIPNWWEARYSRSGSKTGLAASDDDDQDGMSNYAEFVAYTNPTNAMSKFVIGLAQIEVVPVARRMSLVKMATPESTQSFALRWDSALGRVYSVYMCEDLTKGWCAEPVARIDGTGETIEYVPPQTKASGFFKVSVELNY